MSDKEDGEMMNRHRNDAAELALQLAYDIWNESGKNAPNTDNYLEFLALVGRCSRALQGR